jgi:hypothetical protein
LIRTISARLDSSQNYPGSITYGAKDGLLSGDRWDSPSFTLLFRLLLDNQALNLHWDIGMLAGSEESSMRGDLYHAPCQLSTGIFDIFDYDKVN